MDTIQAKRIIEALVFASGKPLSIERIKDVLDPLASTKFIRELICELRQEYENEKRGFRLIEVAGGFQFSTDPQYAAWIKKLLRRPGVDKLSSPSLETLAIIAYKQPVTRTDIEAIRGVNVDGVLRTLLERRLIKVAGRKDAVGRPIIYRTTSSFLEHFGLNSLSDLPKLEEFGEKITDSQSQFMPSEDKLERGTNHEPTGITQEDRPDRFKDPQVT